MRDRFQQCLSCVSRAIFIIDHTDHIRGRSTDERALRLSARPAPLQSTQRIAFYAEVTYRVTTDPDRRAEWWAVITSYAFDLLHDDGQELFAFHWHPAGGSAVHEPHLHLAGLGSQRLDTARLQLPTGWVSLPAVLRFAVQELRVRPLRSDWTAILAEPATEPRGF